MEQCRPDLSGDVPGADPVLNGQAAADHHRRHGRADRHLLAVDVDRVPLAVVGGLDPHQRLIGGRSRHSRRQSRVHRWHRPGVADEGVVRNRSRPDVGLGADNGRQIRERPAGDGDGSLNTSQIKHPDGGLADHRQVLLGGIPQDLVEEDIAEAGGAHPGDAAAALALAQPLGSRAHPIDLHLPLRGVALCVRLLADPLEQVGDRIGDEISHADSPGCGPAARGLASRWGTA